MSQFKLFDLTYTDNVALHYQHFTHLPGFVLLESTDRVRGRYDILSAHPYDYVAINKKSSLQKTIFSVLQEQIPSHDYGLDLPFQGGAIGFFSYDLACEQANIVSTVQKSLDDMPIMHVGLYDWAIIVDHALQKITLFAAFCQPETEHIVMDMLARWHDKRLIPLKYALDGAFMPLVAKSDWQDAFYAIHQDLQRGRCYQVNLTQPFNAPYHGDAWAIYTAIKAYNPVPFSAFIRLDKADILSFSPERFMQMDNHQLLASPIKGTSPRSIDKYQDHLLRDALYYSEKNRIENVMIVDLMRNDFGKIARPGSVKVNSLFDIESYTAVHHMVSHISAWCRLDISLWQAFEACFPGGSITGAPKLESMRVIAEQESFARGVYCGNIGYFSCHGRFDTSIAIRTITATNGILHMAAGGAIVMDSECNDEYQECFTKIAGILKGLDKPAAAKI